jgi:hypothetical protein
MAIEPKKNRTEPDKNKPLVFRDNPEVKKRIDAHRNANPNDAAYYTRLVREHPERAIETFLYKDLQKHENEMKLIAKQLPQAKAFYDSQTPDARARIDRDMEGVHPYYQDKSFVAAALREKDRQSRREFAAPATTPGGAKAAA